MFWASSSGVLALFEEGGCLRGAGVEMSFVPEDVDNYLKPVMLKDLRVQLRARGLSPAGSRDVLVAKLKESMVSSKDL